tara:strand:+ start:315 stop:509 length:195 start_codon:yes stop_codon:yes gene_type:complete
LKINNFNGEKHSFWLKIIEIMVDVPRFELGASSMPRKRASKLRHTPSEIPTCDGHLRRTEQDRL